MTKYNKIIRSDFFFQLKDTNNISFLLLLLLTYSRRNRIKIFLHSPEGLSAFVVKEANDFSRMRNRRINSSVNSIT